MSSTKFVIAAYVVSWVGLIGYALRVARLRRRANALLKQAEAAEAGDSA